MLFADIIAGINGQSNKGFPVKPEKIADQLSSILEGNL